MSTQLIFPMPGFERLIPADPRAEADLEVARFGDDELRVRVHGSVSGCECALIGSVSPPGDALLANMLAAETLKAHGARRVTAVIPYLAYARSDVPDPGGVQSIGVIGRALDGAGVDDLITVDVHSPRAAMLFPIPLISVSPAEPLAEAIAATHVIDQVVAPDLGAFPRARDLAAALRLEDPLSPSQLADAERVLVVDDIVDTGRTLVGCCQTLVERGVKHIVIAVTHPIFRGQEVEELLRLPVRAIFTTDTILEVRRERPYLTNVVTIAPLIRRALAEHSVVGTG